MMEYGLKEYELRKVARLFSQQISNLPVEGRFLIREVKNA